MNDLKKKKETDYHKILFDYLKISSKKYVDLARETDVSETYARHIVNKHKPITRSFIQRLREAGIIS